jgi:hypothetical protein
MFIRISTGHVQKHMRSFSMQSDGNGMVDGQWFCGYGDMLVSPFVYDIPTNKC